MTDASVNESTVTSDSIMDRPLSQLTYKELQSIAMLIGLPANLKQSQMLTMVQARQQGRENIVRRMLAAYREQRSRARLPAHNEPCPSKRRRLSAPKCVASTSSRKLATILPHPPNHTSVTNVGASPVVHVISNSIGSQLINSSSTSQQQQHMSPLPWPYQPAWFAADTTAIDGGPLFSPANDYRAAPFESMLTTGIVANRIQPALFPSQPCQPSFVKHLQPSQYFEPNLIGQQAPFFPTHMMQYANPVQQFGLPYTYVGGEVGMGTVVYEPFVPTYCSFPQNMAENAFYGPGPVWGQPCSLPPMQEMGTIVGTAAEVEASSSQGFSSQQERPEESLSQPLTQEIQYPATYVMPLEGPIYARPWCDVKQEFPSITSSITSTINCYSRPICSVRSSPESILPSVSIPPPHPEVDVTQEDGCCEDECCQVPYSPEDPMPLFSDFHDNDKLSLPLIYNYIASAEEMVRTSLAPYSPEDPMPLFSDFHDSKLPLPLIHNNYSASAEQMIRTSLAPYSPEDPMPLFSDVYDSKLLLPLVNNYNASAEEMFLGQQQPQQQLQDEMVSQSTSSPEVITELSVTDSLTDQKQVAQTAALENFSISKPPSKPARVPCRYQADGCTKQLVPDLLIHHEVICLFRPISCLFKGCFWKGRLGSLEEHLHQGHSEKIKYGIESSHTISIDELQVEESMHFMQETNGKIYVISVYYIGHHLRITMQAVVVDKSSLYVKGSLEVVGHDGSPHGWWGSIHAIGKPLFVLWNQGVCLEVDPRVVGTLDGCITVHSTVFTTGPQRRGGRKKAVAARN